MQSRKSYAGLGNSADQVFFSGWLVCRIEKLSPGEYERWFRAPERLCVEGAGRNLLEGRVQIRKSGEGEMDLHPGPPSRPLLLCVAETGCLFGTYAHCRAGSSAETFRKTSSWEG